MTFEFTVTKAEPRITYLKYYGEIEALNQKEAEAIIRSRIKDGTIEDIVKFSGKVDDADLDKGEISPGIIWEFDPSEDDF